MAIQRLDYFGAVVVIGGEKIDTITSPESIMDELDSPNPHMRASANLFLGDEPYQSPEILAEVERTRRLAAKRRKDAERQRRHRREEKRKKKWYASKRR